MFQTFCLLSMLVRSLVKYQVWIDAKRLTVCERGDVVYIFATGCADKYHSDLENAHLIKDMGRPFGLSVNNCTTIVKYRLSFVASAYALMSPVGWMSEIDLFVAYKFVGFCTRLWRYLAYGCQGTTSD